MEATKSKDVADIINSVENTYISEELKRILTTIEVRASVGDYYIDTFTIKHNGTVETLKSKGYSVEKDTRFHDSTLYRISWEEVE